MLYAVLLERSCYTVLDKVLVNRSYYTVLLKRSYYAVLNTLLLKRRSQTRSTRRTGCFWGIKLFSFTGKGKIDTSLQEPDYLMVSRREITSETGVFGFKLVILHGNTTFCIFSPHRILEKM